MWPTTGTQRAALARHLLQCDHDPIYLTNLLSRSIVISSRNGFVYVEKTPIAFENRFVTPLVSTATKVDVAADELTQLALHILWYGLSGRSPIIVSFVQVRRAEEPLNLFWSILYSNIAWLLTPPKLIISSMRIGRPDLQYRVQYYYMRWIQLTNSPNEITSALEILLAKPMHFSSWTRVWDTAEQFLEYNGTQLAAVGPVAQYNSDCVVVPKLSKYTIVLNKCGKVAISERDIIMLILQLLFDETDGFVTQHSIPVDAPEQFHILAETHPYLFDKEKKAPKVNFNELEIISFE